MIPSRYMFPDRRIRRIANRAALAIAVPLATLVYAPQLLAFPYEARFGETVVRSEAPLPPGFAVTLARADALVARSPLYAGPVPRSIFLTRGGWRWRIAALGASDAIALRRNPRNLIIVDRADPAADRAGNGAPLGGIRTLHDTIAHETAHILITDHFGALHALAFPTWKVEGYCDHVAGASSLDEAAALRARARDPHSPGLRYHDMRVRVDAALARDPDVDHLFLGRP